jgi:hypothetical protein
LCNLLSRRQDCAIEAAGRFGCKLRDVERLSRPEPKGLELGDQACVLRVRPILLEQRGCR